MVEDDGSVRKAFGRLVRSAGLAADTYASGEEFLQAIPRRLPDCVLLDLQLPGMDGLGVQAWLRASAIKLPVVFITAINDVASRDQAMQHGATAWLRKPVDDLALLEAIAKALSGKNVPPAA